MATSSSAAASKETNESLISCDFEIFGTVQGVFFRKYTQQQATKLNLVGWVKNAASGTVQGHMEGPKDNINQMKNWLRTKGSPKSKITKAEFSNEKTITQLNGKSFSVNK
jgi:acylphosphatase